MDWWSLDLTTGSLTTALVVLLLHQFQRLGIHIFLQEGNT